MSKPETTVSAGAQDPCPVCGEIPEIRNGMWIHYCSTVNEIHCVGGGGGGGLGGLIPLTTASGTAQTTVKAYALTAYDDSGKLVAAEFVEGLTIGVLDGVERWTDQGAEFRIRRVMERADAK